MRNYSPLIFHFEKERKLKKYGINVEYCFVSLVKPGVSKTEKKVYQFKKKTKQTF